MRAVVAAISATESVPADAAFATQDSVTLVEQVRTFLWLAAGMFSMSALGLAFLDYFIARSATVATTHILAAVVSSGLFGLATLLKLGPSEA